MSQNPDTKDYVIVLDYAKGRDLYYQINRNYNKFDWNFKLNSLFRIIIGLKNIHQKQMVHRDFHAGNILFYADLSLIVTNESYNLYISDMGLCGEVGNTDETKIYGVMPYVAPEVLRGKLYTQAADIYSFGMIMYFIATGKQPFANCAHDELLAINICNGVRPEISELEAPHCYIDLMKKCWNSNPDNRPTATEIEDLIESFFYYNREERIEKQFVQLQTDFIYVKDFTNTLYNQC